MGRRNCDQRRAIESNFRGVWGARNSGPNLSLLSCWLLGGLWILGLRVNHPSSTCNASQLPPALPMSHFLSDAPRPMHSGLLLTDPPDDN